MKKINGTFSYKKDIGKIRNSNEDEVKVLVNAKSNVLMMVADGMGGAKKGDFASKTTLDHLTQSFKEKNGFFSSETAKNWLIQKVKEVNSMLYNLQDSDPFYQGMGTTLVVVIIFKKKVIILNSGDSRCYFFKDGTLIQKTEDQTYVNFLYKSGQINQNEIYTHPKRHVLTNAIGLYPSVSFDINVYKYNNEGIFLCSDGLYNNVSKTSMEAILNTKQSIDDRVNDLINQANYNGGSDNISCALWESTDA